MRSDAITTATATAGPDASVPEVEPTMPPDADADMDVPIETTTATASDVASDSEAELDGGGDTSSDTTSGDADSDGTDPDAGDVPIPILARAPAATGLDCTSQEAAMLTFPGRSGRMELAQLASGVVFALVAIGVAPDFAISLVPFAADNTFGPAVFTETSPGLYIEDLALARSGADLVALWRPANEGGAAFRAVRFASDGAVQIAPHDLPQTGTRVLGLRLLPPADAAVPPGTLEAFWQQYSADATSYPTIMHARLAPDGTWSAAPTQAAARAYEDFAAVVTPSGFVVLWIESASDRDQLRFSNFADDGTLRETHVVTTFEGVNANYPQLVARTGGFLAAWSEQNTIRVAALDTGGRPTAPTAPLGSISGAPADLLAASGQAVLIDLAPHVGVFWHRRDDTDLWSDYSGPVHFVALDPSELAPASAPILVYPGGGLALWQRAWSLRPLDGTVADPGTFRIFTSYTANYHAGSATRAADVRCVARP